MEGQTFGTKLAVGIALAALALLLACGSCLGGILLAPHARDLLPLGEEPRKGLTRLPSEVTKEIVPPESTPTSAPPDPAATPTSIPPSALEEGDSEERLVADVYQRVAPSVVHIRVVQRVSGAEPPDLEIPGWPDFPGMPDAPDDFYRQGEGSGFVWDNKGHVVTNYHVVKDAEKVEVTFFDDVTVLAEVVGGDPDSDLAVLKVDRPADQLHPVTVGNSDAVFVGQRAIAIGNPFGQEWTLTTGVVSALSRTLPSGTSQFSIPEMIQTDAAINPGNSGGPLLDRGGQVIGVNTMIMSRYRSSAGIGFAIPVSIVKRVVPELIEEGDYVYAWLGIAGRDLERNTAIEMDLPPGQRGALIIEVVEESPAEKAGLQGSDERARIDGVEVPIGGDVIIAVEDRQVSGMDDLIVYLVEETRPGQDITLVVLRDGLEERIEVTLGERPRES